MTLEQYTKLKQLIKALIFEAKVDSSNPNSKQLEKELDKLMEKEG